MNEKSFMSFPLANGFTCGMSLLSAGSMRFRGSEVNKNRIDFISALCPEGYSVCQVELIHSKKVIAVNCAEDAAGIKCDGIVTNNPFIIPMVTVADCMPIFIAEPKSGVFGVLHSGWKGTGILEEALTLCSRTYGTKAQDFYVALGPHIRNCCYNVDEARAIFFNENFSSDCAALIKNPKDSKYSFALSLEKANLAILLKLCIPQSHIFLQGECTCCTKYSDGIFKYGSSRRQTLDLPSDMSPQEKSRYFTVQAACIIKGHF